MYHWYATVRDGDADELRASVRRRDEVSYTVGRRPSDTSDSAEKSADSSSLAAVEPSDVGTPLADRSRHGLFRYLTADESADYLAIMDLFSATLLTDLSAAEVAAELAERGLTIDRDIAEARCRQHVAWGNLVPSLRDARVSTVAEYIRSRSVTKCRSSAGACTVRPSRYCTQAMARAR